MHKLTDKGVGKLIVKEYPTGAASAIHFRALLKELQIKRDFKPDLICIDYLNICSSCTYESYGWFLLCCQGYCGRVERIGSRM